MKPSVFRVVVVVLASAAVLAAAGFAAAPARAAASPVADRGRRRTYPPYPASLTVKSELRLKADLIQRNLAEGAASSSSSAARAASASTPCSPGSAPA